MLLFDAAHHHAEVAGFADHADALGLQHFVMRFGHLVRQALLQLQAAREHVHDARDFAQPDHFILRQIGHVHGAEERQQ
jgi:hypothetical protein